MNKINNHYLPVRLKIDKVTPMSVRGEEYHSSFNFDFFLTFNKTSERKDCKIRKGVLLFPLY